MSPPPRALRIAALVGAALVLTYVALWTQVSPRQIGRADFTSTYVGGTLLREGHRADLYDERVQAPLHARLISPDGEGNLPFVNPPTAALVSAPFTLLPLDSAYRLWSALQAVLVVVACMVATGGVPRRRATAIAVVLIALASPALLRLLLLGQWNGVSALGLAVAYRCWRSERMALGGAVVAGSAMIAKPHVAIGLAAFLLGWRQWRVLLGAVVATVSAVFAWLAIATPSGVAGWVALTAADAHRWDAATFVGFTGLTGALLGNTTASTVLAVLLSLAGVVGAAVLGRRARLPERLPVALAGAAVLTALVSPHVYDHDLVIIPVVLSWWLIARLGAGMDSRQLSVTVIGWLSVCAAQLAVQGSGRPGLVVPSLLLLVLAGLLRRAPEVNPARGGAISAAR
ncbi:MAG: glycosyltransferase family 87 protein [Candidatus Dormibacteria bacterium]